MPEKTYVIRDTHGCYYRSFCNSFFTTAHSEILVINTDDLSKARRFHSLMWAMYKARFLSNKASCWYYVFEVISEEAEQKLLLKNEQAIEKIRENNLEAMKKVERIVAEWKTRHGLN